MAIKALSFVPLLICLLLASLAAANVEGVCKMIASKDDRVRFSFCVETLAPAPGVNSTAPDHGYLATYAAEEAVKQGKSALARIHQLSQNLTDPRIATPLRSCHGTYDNTIVVVGNAIDALNLRNLVYARACFSVAVWVPRACEMGFVKAGVPSPLTSENTAMRQLIGMGLTLTNS